MVRPVTPQPSSPASPARRAFLRGRVSSASPSAKGQGSGRAAIGDACLARRGIECRVCGESCGTAAIRFRPALGSVSQPELNTQACNGCGECVAACPGLAIALAYEITEGVVA